SAVVAVGKVSAKAVPVKNATPAQKPAVIAVQPKATSVKPAVHAQPKALSVKVAAPAKTNEKKAATTEAKASTPKPESAPEPKSEASVEENKPATENKEISKVIHFEGRRDPFISPVMAASATGSGCSSGKRCLSVDQIALKGVLKS